MVIHINLNTNIKHSLTKYLNVLKPQHVIPLSICFNNRKKCFFFKWHEKKFITMKPMKIGTKW